jgi:hypothetical protein
MWTNKLFMVRFFLRVRLSGGLCGLLRTPASRRLAVYDKSDNTIDGTTAAARNVISANQGSGASVLGLTATGSRVLQNSIFCNGGLGVDLGDDGPTANDSGDADTGPNNLQNKPAIISAKTRSLKTTIRGTLNSIPNKTFAVRLFSNPQEATRARST